MSQLLCMIEQASQTLADRIRLTPLTRSLALSKMIDGQVYLKQENQQITGCCKARSAFYTLASLLSESDVLNQRPPAVVTVSTGNNGIATAWAAQELGLSSVVFLPYTVSEYKVQRMQENNVEIIFHGDDLVQTEIAARSYAKKKGAIFISPYNEWGAIYGQGTIGLEVAQQLSALEQHLDSIIIPVGGGGLISGIGGYFYEAQMDVKLIGAQPANSAVMAHSVRAGHILEMPSFPTLSDATAGGVEQGSITFDFCRTLVDDYVLVNEVEIAHAMRFLADEHDIVVEGAGALSIAAFLQRKEEFVGRTIVLLLCGSNIGAEKFHQVQQGQTGEELVYA